MNGPGGCAPSPGSNGNVGALAFAELQRRGVGWDLAAKTAGSIWPWRLSSPALTIAMPTAYIARPPNAIDSGFGRIACSATWRHGRSRGPSALMYGCPGG